MKPLRVGPSGNPDLLTEAEAAALLRLQPVTLKKWRCTGRGPPFVRLGSAVRYERAALLAFVECARITPQGASG
jgi:hypothetical protein